MQLYSWQKEAIAKLHSGAVLYGEVGSGKTFTALVYYKQNYGQLPLYVITTAKKRDSGDWEDEAATVGVTGITVDSWNNILDYVTVHDAFFIFDEQRAVGYGTWAKTFIKLARKNKWIMLTGSPGDTWMDYLAIFVANGFYKNKTDFINQHVEYDRFVKFPKIKAYHNQSKLQAERHQVLVGMHMVRKTERERIDIVTGYDKQLYRSSVGDRHHRWNPFKDCPIKTPGEYTQVCRKIVGDSKDRKYQATRVLNNVERAIVFYNYEYEREALIAICEKNGLTYSQWNGKKHEEIPNSSEWIYIVQYTAGAEGWNCTETDTMIFYSPNYSYKIMEQAEGRIDRLNTSYTHLKYYFLQSESPIDRAVFKAIEKKRRFNASAWAKEVQTFAGERLSISVDKGYLQTMARSFRI